MYMYINQHVHILARTLRKRICVSQSSSPPRPCYFVLSKQPFYLNKVASELVELGYISPIDETQYMPTVEDTVGTCWLARQLVCQAILWILITFLDVCFSLSRVQLRERQLKIYISSKTGNSDCCQCHSSVEKKKSNRKGFSTFKTWYQLACAQAS